MALARNRERGEALTRAAEAARNAAQLARQRYSAGLIDFQTVLDTERTRAVARGQPRQHAAPTACWRSSDSTRRWAAAGRRRPTPARPARTLHEDSDTHERRPGRRPAAAPRDRVAAAVLAPQALAGRRAGRGRGVVGAAGSAAPATQAAGPRYTTEPATVGTLVVTVSATGNLQPTNKVDVGSELSGIVDEVLVDDNDRVKKGQVLARLDLVQARRTRWRSRAPASPRPRRRCCRRRPRSRRRARTLARFKQVARAVRRQGAVARARWTPPRPT